MVWRADLYEARKAKLGPDPLREDADAELLWTRVQGSRKPIGQLLMDQDAVAGLGNIYRAEVLFKVATCEAPLLKHPLSVTHDTCTGSSWLGRVSGVCKAAAGSPSESCIFRSDDVASLGALQTFSMNLPKSVWAFCTQGLCIVSGKASKRPLKDASESVWAFCTQGLCIVSGKASKRRLKDAMPTC